MIAAQDVSFSYDGALVLGGVSVRAASGEVVGLIGPNGSGKTTLLRTLYRALVPKAGLVTLDDTPIEDYSDGDRARRLAIVVQEGEVDLPFTVSQMVLLGRSVHRSVFQGYTTHDYHIAATALQRVGLRELADRAYTTLSGGEKQRVLIARTLAQEADHLLLDEPTNHLDIRYQHEILQLVRTLDVATIVVLHELNLAARYCDQLVLLDKGRVSCAGSVTDVLTPAVLEPVYGVSVESVTSRDCLQLIFSPLPSPLDSS